MTEQHSTAQHSTAQQRLWSYLFAIVASVGGMGCSDVESREFGDLAGFELRTLSGEPLSVKDAFGKADYAFFTCGCDPCVKVGQTLSRSRSHLVCVSYLPVPELQTFLRATSWKFPVFRDPDSRLMVRLRALDCPVVLSLRSLDLPRVDPWTLSESTARGGVS
jgi:hypothetical protein